MREWLVDEFLHGCIWSEGDFGMSLDFDSFPCVYVDTFPAIYFCKFESSESLYFDVLFRSQRFFYQLNHGSDESLGIFFVHALFFAKRVDQVL